MGATGSRSFSAAETFLPAVVSGLGPAFWLLGDGLASLSDALSSALLGAFLGTLSEAISRALLEALFKALSALALWASRLWSVFFAFSRSEVLELSRFGFLFGLCCVFLPERDSGCKHLFYVAVLILKRFIRACNTCAKFTHRLKVLHLISAQE